MKKLLLALAVVALMSSCYNTRIFVGSVDKNDPLVEVNHEWNHHLIGGLVALNNTKMIPKNYVNDAENYVIKTNTSFVNYVVSFFTFGIYTPTQTKFYIPLKDVNKK